MFEKPNDNQKKILTFSALYLASVFALYMIKKERSEEI